MKGVYRFRGETSLIMSSLTAWNAPLLSQYAREASS
jgi:hypothetical protein